MTIENGISNKHLKIYPPTKLSTKSKNPFWIEEENDEPIFPTLTIDRASSLKGHGEDWEITLLIKELTWKILYSLEET